MSARRDRECVACNRVRRHKGRGLCDACWYRNWKDGTLDDFERTLRLRAEVLEDWAFLEAQGYTRADACARMGITTGALEKAIERERRAQQQAASEVAA